MDADDRRLEERSLTRLRCRHPGLCSCCSPAGRDGRALSCPALPALPCAVQPPTLLAALHPNHTTPVDTTNHSACRERSEHPHSFSSCLPCSPLLLFLLFGCRPPCLLLAQPYTARLQLALTIFAHLRLSLGLLAHPQSGRYCTTRPAVFEPVSSRAADDIYDGGHSRNSAPTVRDWT